MTPPAGPPARGGSPLRFVAFADAAGNPHAVAAILAAAKKVDEAELVCLGNAVAPGAQNAACVEKLRKAHVHLVRGAWDAAALGMPSAPEMRLQGKEILAELKPADAAYLREATPARRLVAGGRRILLTSETEPDAGQADVVLHAGARALVRRDGARLAVATGRADDAEHAESPYVVFDASTGEAQVRFAAWDRMARRSATRQL